MTHVLLGTNEDDLALLRQCATGEPAETTWIVPKAAQPGDATFFFVPAAGIVGGGVVRSVPKATMFRSRQTYQAAVGAIVLLPAPVPVAFLRHTFPDWGWPRYPRTYTSLDADLSERVGKALSDYQREVGDANLTVATLVEGSVAHRAAIVFERSPEARAACIRHYGTACAACGFDFGTVYGPAFEGFIHVHHLTPLSAVRAAYVIDPLNDLRPLCANCHAIAHRREPPFSVEELRLFIQSSAQGAEA